MSYSRPTKPLVALEELTSVITKNYRQRSLPALVIKEAREKLSSIFGYEMKELQRSRLSSNKQSRASQQSGAEAKSYIVMSQLPSDIYSKYNEDKKTSHVTGFSFVVISIVHLAGETLWHQLKRMGLNESDENHPLFGNTKQTLEALVQQRYLNKEKANGPEGNTVVYELAERTLDESINDKLKYYIAQLYWTSFSTLGHHYQRRLLLFCLNIGASSLHLHLLGGCS